ncbi:hypothetical protein HK105_205376 [Polyrhizophydium stewartii]|uniref:Uncharacterized protein n=1 Tax=Polyrhizophydium stewartii TaxID=2732419 RepID=A0ABR4N6E9_9FUNG|nr:hypothetical protein HK105_007930 [Polyrhizophydium stewartii]
MSAVKRAVRLYEVTFGLYMLEPWEKTLFNSIILVFAGFFVYACYRWLPLLSAEAVSKFNYYLVSS